MGSSDGVTGYKCIKCGRMPAFNMTGEYFCYKHLPWNDGKTDEEIDQAIKALGWK